jgi:MFS transporter, DHA2 family, multidrug resistance protein
MLSQMSLQISIVNLIWPNIIFGLSTSTFVPLTVLAIGTLPNEQIGNALSIQNLIRTIGGSVGLSYVSTMLARYSQVHQAMMVEHMSSLNLQYQQYLRSAQLLLEQYFSPADALSKAHDLLYNILIQQVTYWSFVNIYFVVACMSFFCVLCVLTFKTPQKVQILAPGGD